MEHTDLQSKVVSTAAFHLIFFTLAFVYFLPCRFWKCCTLLSRLHAQKWLLAVIFLRSEVVLLRDESLIVIVGYLPLCIGKIRWNCSERGLNPSMQTFSETERLKFPLNAEKSKFEKKNPWADTGRPHSSKTCCLHPALLKGPCYDDNPLGFACCWCAVGTLPLGCLSRLLLLKVLLSKIELSAEEQNVWCRHLFSFVIKSNCF